MSNPFLSSLNPNVAAGFSQPSDNPWNFSDQVQQQIVSTVKHILQNISYHLLHFNGSVPLLNLDLSSTSPMTPISPSQEVNPIVDMSNFTLAMFSETFDKYTTRHQILDPTSMSHLLLHTLFQLGPYLQYFITFISILIGGWVYNRLTSKSEFITNILETAISFVIFLPVLPGIGLFFFGLLGARALVSLYLRLVHPPNKFSLLNGVDGFWACESYASCSTCLGLYIIEGVCDIDKIRTRMKKTTESELVGGKMSRKLTSCWGFPVWETIPSEEMKMEKYVKVVGGSKDSLGGTSHPMEEEDIFQFMSTIQDKPIDDMAPWTVYIIPRCTYKSESGESSDASKTHYAVIYRLHHSIMDGISTANILHSIMADKPFKFSVDPIAPFGPSKSPPTPWATAFLHFLGILSMPRVALRNLFLIDFNTKYYHSVQQLTGPKTLNWSQPIRMDAIKEIKNSTQTSVYAVLLSSLGGAFRQYYSKTRGSSSLDNFNIMFPVALLPYPDRKPRNRFTGLIVPIELKNSSPIQRLQTNYSNLKALGSSSATFLAIANYYYLAFLGIHPLFLQKPLSLMVNLTMSLSNVPGPEEDVWIYDGGKIVDIGIWLPIKYSMGFGMGLFSYKNKVRATVIGDKAYYPKDSDVEFLTKAFENELTLLGNSVGIRNVFMD